MSRLAKIDEARLLAKKKTPGFVVVALSASQISGILKSELKKCLKLDATAFDERIQGHLVTVLTPETSDLIGRLRANELTYQEAKNKATTELDPEHIFMEEISEPVTPPVVKPEPGSSKPKEEVQSTKTANPTLMSAEEELRKALARIKLEGGAQQETAEAERLLGGTIKTEGKMDSTPTTQKRNTGSMKPQSFGLSIWDPSKTSLIDHLSSSFLALKNARRVGTDEPTLCNILLLSLPASYSYLDSLIQDRSSLKAFVRQILRFMGTSNSDLLSLVYDAVRRPSESLISFLGRLKMLTELSDEGDTNATAKILYHRVLSSANDSTRIEIRRILEDDLDKQKLTFAMLQAGIMKAQKLAPTTDELDPETQKILSIQESAKSVEGDSKKNENVEAVRKPRPLSEIKCYNCRSFGHYARNCPTRRRGTRRTRESYAREPRNPSGTVTFADS
ncbi:Oidioi.mRNA.OKI2018_I69.chr1.g3803.t1.cds [Oikopleura dioica]|uniref:Oidioi.mRNA.OKI2018_I69.chr1.g3803.t1.cds n=1 Tax=Oikopleura dioica TaxID=34765 RepID=A0ABN7T0S8_OIKDI|nr:Oidioi.mRNA.OKI2018_I69.chr1.g3803.t1.cds [Oikopleura dioica]